MTCKECKGRDGNSLIMYHTVNNRDRACSFCDKVFEEPIFGWSCDGFGN